MPLNEVQQVQVATDTTNPVFNFTQTTQDNLLVVGIVSNNTITTPAGWTACTTYSGGSAAVQIFGRLAPAGTYVTQTFTTGGADAVGLFVEYSGNVTSSFANCLDRVAQVNNSTSSGTTATTTQADELAFAVLGAGSNSSGAWSAPANSFVEEADVQSAGGSGTEVTMCVLTRALSATGTYSTSATNAAPTGDKSGCIATFKAAAGGGSPQDVSPTAISSAEAFGTATVNLNIAPPSIASAEAFGSTTVSFPGQAVSPVAIASSEAFGTTVVGMKIQPTAIASTESFGTAAVKLQVQPAGIAPGEAFGTHAVKLGISLTGITSAEAFGAVTVTQIGPQSITLAGIPSEEAFGGATVTTVTYRYFFIPPVYPFRSRTRGRFWGRYANQMGVTVLRVGSLYEQHLAPSASEVEGADAVYWGGRKNPITEAEAVDLQAAGFAAYITQEIS